MSVPIFCCIASMVAGFSYCYLILKPTNTVDSARRHLANLRSRAITPSFSMSQTANSTSKDLPPSYAELFQISKNNTNFIGPINDLTNSSNILFTKQTNNIRLLSPPPPAYNQSNINVV